MSPNKKLRSLSYVSFLFILIIITVTLTSCIKTEEKLITAIDECEPKKQFADPNDYRDQYDECLTLVDEEIKRDEGCMSYCNKYCLKHNMDFDSFWIDIAGCRCSCKIRI